MCTHSSVSTGSVIWKRSFQESEISYESPGIIDFVLYVKVCVHFGIIANGRLACWSCPQMVRGIPLMVNKLIKIDLWI